MSAFCVIDGHNGHPVSRHRSRAAADLSMAKRIRALRRWQDAPHGGNRTARVWVEIRDARGKLVAKGATRSPSTATAASATSTSTATTS